MNKVMIAVLLLASFSVEAAGIYKWVDENGVTHFGSQKPASTKVEEIRVAGEAPVKQVSEETQKDINSLAKVVLKDYGDAQAVNCNKAVENAKYSLETMLEVGQKNYKSGYIKAADYHKQSKELKKIKRRISLSECRRSEGKVQGFYKCMSNDYNHVARCGEKYDYAS